MKIKIRKIFTLLLVISSAIVLTSCAKSTSKENYIDKVPKEKKQVISEVVKISENNSNQIISSIIEIDEKELEGLLFLLENMPERDLRALSKKYLIDNVKLSYSILDSVKWGNKIPKEIFYNYILPYVNLHERRDNWRADFKNKFLPLVKDLSTPSEGAVELNNKIWDVINVHYSTKRPKADQSPYESIEAGLASCTGLSVLLVDACRSVGIPARFVGVPLWKDHSGNHSWVEIWDNGWHYIGAGEPGPLDKTWFGERAALSDDSNWKYSIYATSYKKTDVVFPPLFDSTATYVYADIVTEHYSKQLSDDGLIALGIRLFDKKGGSRIIGNVELQKNDEKIAEGITTNEKHDFNDFLVFRVAPSAEYKILANYNGNQIDKVVKTNNDKYQFVELYLDGNN